MSLWTNPPYYLTAYGIAVKHGFYGTEEEWLKSLKGEPVGAVTEYAVSEDGSKPPSSGWSGAPDPTAAKGKYVWTRTTVTWDCGEKTPIYSAAYFGLDGSGSVISVNGEDGVVVLTASDIPTSDTYSIQENLTILNEILDDFVYVKDI